LGRPYGAQRKLDEVGHEQTYLEKEHQSNDINRVEEPKKDKIKVNEEVKGENI
jgi:hypothetical protein